MDTLERLCDDIQSRHHSLLRHYLPRLDQMLETLVAHHGSEHPKLNDAQQSFRKVKAKIETHLADEERLLFPCCIKLERGEDISLLTGETNLLERIDEMEQEHENAGKMLDAVQNIVREVKCVEATNPETFQTFIKDLDTVIEDLRIHVQKENELFHPQARRLLNSK